MRLVTHSIDDTRITTTVNVRHRKTCDNEGKYLAQLAPTFQVQRIKSSQVISYVRTADGEKNVSGYVQSHPEELDPKIQNLI